MNGSAPREMLEARLERDQRELMAVLGGLRERVRGELDPRRRIQERPGTWLAAAALVGLWLGTRR